MLRSDGAGTDIFVSVGARNVVEHVRRSKCSQFGPIFVRSCSLSLKQSIQQARNQPHNDHKISIL